MFYDKMYVAQKILKSMSSISAEVSEDNDDMDDVVHISKSIRLSSTPSPSISERQPSLTPPTDESFTVDPLSSTCSETAAEITNSMTFDLHKRTNWKILFILDVSDIEPSSTFDTATTNYPADSGKTSTPGSMDTFDFQYDFI